MASRASLIQSRSIYVGTLNSVAPSDGNLIVTGNVGIGTTSPDTKLEVVGQGSFGNNSNLSIQSDAFVTVRADAFAGIDVTSLRTSGNIGGLRAVDSSGTLKGQLLLKVNGDFEYFSGSSILYITSSGNVGIGTTAPTYGLVVANQSTANSATGTMYIGAVLNGSGKGLVIDSTTRTTSDNAVLALEIINRAGGNTMAATVAGNVGIGTTSPSAQLEIRNSEAGDGVGGATLRLTRSDITSVAGDPVGTIEFYSTDADTPKVTAYVKSMSEELYGRKGSLAFGVSQAINTDATEAMRISDTGNVGIGTDAPGKRLDISHDGNATNGIRVTNTNTGTAARASLTLTSDSATIDFYATSNAYNGVSGWNDAGVITTLSACSNGLILNSQVGGIKFQDATSTVMVVSDGGNVGINTTSPTYKLHVSGNSYIDAIDASATLTLGRYSGQPTIKAGTDDGGWLIMDSSGSPVSINHYSSNIITLGLGGGNVGIGTTSPAQKLDVVGSTQVSGQFAQGVNVANKVFNYGAEFRTSGASIQIVMGRDTTGAGSGGIGADENSIFSAWNVDSGASEKFRIDKNGLLFIDGRIAKATDTDTYFELIGSNVARIVTGGDERMRITDGGNVGIGTTSPAFKLEVNAGSNAGMWLQGTSDARYHVFSSSSNDWVGYELRSSNVNSFAGGMFRNNASNNRVSLYNKNTEAISLMDTGNVGIGTTSPTAKLQVVLPANTSSSIFQSTASESLLRIQTFPTTNRMQLLVGDYNGTNTPNIGAISDSDTGIQWSGSNVLRFVNGGSENVTINASGNVGIGTTSPLARLHTVASGTYSTSTFNGSIVVESAIPADGAYGAGIILTAGRGALANGGAAISSFYDTGDNDRAGLAFFYHNATFADPRTEGFRLTAQGNVGIGTTSPAGKLHIQNGSAGSVTPNTSYDELIIENSGNTGISFLTPDSNTAGLTWATPSDALSALLNYNNSNGLMSIGTYAVGGEIQFLSGNAGNSVRINSSGNVGIGTTAPTVPLHIVKDNATINMTNTSAFAVDTGSRLFLGGKYSSATSNNTTPFAWIVGAKENATDGNQAGYLSITTTANGGGFAERMRITSGGNVGIGTTNPANTLQIGSVGATGYSGNRLAVGDGTNVVALHPGAVSYLTANGDIVVGAGGNTTNQVYVKSGGNVGIGTTAPASRLHIETSASNPFRMVRGTTNFGFEIGGGTIGLYDYEDVTYRWFVDSVGNVGIGTTAPSVKLHVAGSTFIDSGFLYMSSGLPIVWGSAESIEGSTGVINIKTASTSRIYVNSTGNVGIGTTAPTNRLTVTTATNAVDVLRLNNTGGDSGSVQGVTHLAINHFNSGTNPSTRITAYQDSTSGWPGGMYFSTRSLNTDSAPVERMRITSGGNVGIGTNDPIEKLHVDGNILSQDNTGNYREIRVVSQGAAALYGGNQSSPWDFYFGDNLWFEKDGAGILMTLTPTGNLGIGTTSPGFKLHVAGDVQIDAQGTGPSASYVPDGGFGVDNLLTSSTENVALGKPDIWLRIHIDGVPFVFPGYTEP